FRALPTDGFGASNLARFGFAKIFFGAVSGSDSSSRQWRGGLGLWLWGFLWCRGWGFVGVGKFRPAVPRRNRLRRPATHCSLRWVWRRSAGLVWGASGCALRPLTPGFPDPHRRPPAPGALAAKETVGTAIPLWRGIATNGRGVCVA